MGEQRRYKVADDRFGRRALTLREKAGLTQSEVAQTLGVSVRAIQQWESGTTFPSAGNLKQLIVLFLQRAAFEPGHEREEAEALWIQADESAGRRRSLFDAPWFDALLAQRDLPQERAQVPLPPAALQRLDWGEAPDISTFCGREQELATLSNWVLVDRCRVVALVGIGGMGKTTLALKVAQLAAPHVTSICWRSLRDAPPLLTLLNDCLQALAGRPLSEHPQTAEQGITLLLERLRHDRCLLILDNVETLFEAESIAGHYREEHAKYRLLFQRLAETPHQSCVLLTSRELLSELEPLEGPQAPVRVLRLGGLARSATLELLKDKVLFGSEAAWEQFVAHYSGNPLALKIAAATVRDLFGGNITAYLNDALGALVSLQELLANQFERLTLTERDLLIWLAIEREGATIEQLAANIYPPVARRELIIAIKSLRQRTLIERSEQDGRFALLPVVMEFVSDTLVSQLIEELHEGKLQLLTRYALMKSQSADYIRESQQRMLVQPILSLLLARFGNRERLVDHLRELLRLLRETEQAKAGYAGGNLVNVLVALQGHLRDVDCSHLALRQAYLIGVEAQGARLLHSDLHEARFTEPLEPIARMALSSDGRYLAVSSSSGQVRLWQVADAKPLWSDQRHGHLKLALAFSADGTQLVSGSIQGQLQLWEVVSGHCLRTIESALTWIRAVALSPDKTTLVGAGDEGLIQGWQLVDGTPQQVLQGHRARVWSLSFSSNGAYLISSSADGSVRIWDTTSWECVRVLEHAPEAVTVKSAVHPEGLVIASCGEEDGLIKLWGVHSGECHITVARHSTGPASVAFNPEGTLLVSGSSAGMLELWEVGGSAGLTYLKMLHGHRTFVSTVAFAQQNRLASMAYAGRARLWDARSGKLLKTFQGYSRQISTLCFSPTGDRLVLGDNNGMVQLWNVVSGSRLHSSQGHHGAIRGIAVSQDGNLFASSGDDQQIVLWDGRSGRQLAVLRGHGATVVALAFSSKQPLLVSGSADGEIRRWELEGLNAIPVSTSLAMGSAFLASLAFAPDGQTLASGHSNGEVCIWDVAQGVRLQRLRHSGSVTLLRFSSDGQTLFTGGSDTLSWWEVTSGRRRRIISSAETASDGISTVLDEGRVFRVITLPTTILRLWLVAEGDEAQQFSSIVSQAGEVVAGVLSQEAQLVALSNETGVVTIYDYSSGDAVHRLVSDRPYERMRIDGATGLNDEQRAALRALGAVEDGNSGFL